MHRLVSPSTLSQRRVPRGVQMLLLLAALLMAAAGAVLHPANATAGAIDTVPALDLGRYGGVWYELAHGGPQPGRRGCVTDVVTQMRPEPGQRLQLTQLCRRLDGRTATLRGLALPQGPARFEVSWLPAGLRWLPAGRQDHWVVALDPQYRVTVISDRHGALQRVLAREPQVQPEAYAALMAHLRSRGFEVGHLVPTLQVSTQAGPRPAVWAAAPAQAPGA
ncbi:lipocalin family protein [Azohydromonas caseinilytica]|uniref:Outer membrane lipoprotein Blc n=1 Tax=Azohydromonas caseinilytica TaxID=2728836 RepID=A0A848F3X0_9BURK|nr:lipocalin family protein [Azohydromonas caseinilytica]NML13768.1 lipocalin family protein [Azohydromonas caseinilytica]